MTMLQLTQVSKRFTLHHRNNAQFQVLQDVSLAHERAYAWGNITLSLGFSDVDSTGTTVLEDGVRGFVSWRHALR